jgi:hypothetical protein
VRLAHQEAGNLQLTPPLRQRAHGAVPVQVAPA